MPDNLKVRRVDLWPDDWLGGIGNLSLPARGVYLTACLLIYSRGGPIEREHLRLMCPSRSRQFGSALDELIHLNKLLPVDGDRLDQRRCEVEIGRARDRIKAAQASANDRWHPVDNSADEASKEPRRSHDEATTAPVNGELTEAEFNETNTVADANASNPHMLAKRRSQEGSKVFKKPKGVLGSAPRAHTHALAREAPSEPHSAEDKAAVDRLVGDTVAVFRLGTAVRRDGVYRPDAYRQAIAVAKRDQWLNALAGFVTEAFDDMPARMAAWEAIEQARNAGSRDATPPEVRRALDKLSQLRDSLDAHAEAAE